MPELLVFPQDPVLQAIEPARRSSGCGTASSSTPATSGRCRRRSTSTPRRNGDFRAMPAKGAGLAILKWVTSFPGNPQAGLPVVMGVICVSSAADGEPLALVDVRAVTALRTGAVAAVAAQELAREDARTVGIDRLRPPRHLGGALPRGGRVRPGRLLRPRPRGRRQLAGELGWEAGTREDALALRRRDLRHARQRAGGRRRRPPPGPAPQHARRGRARARRRPSPRRWPRASSSATSGPRRATAASSPARSRPAS